LIADCLVISQGRDVYNRSFSHDPPTCE
jgi:hypothetical protein